MHETNIVKISRLLLSLLGVLIRALGAVCVIVIPVMRVFMETIVIQAVLHGVDHVIKTQAIVLVRFFLCVCTLFYLISNIF